MEQFAVNIAREALKGYFGHNNGFLDMDQPFQKAAVSKVFEFLKTAKGFK